MTISIKLPNASFAKNIGNVLLPYMEDAIAYHLYGGDYDETRKNRAAGGSIQMTAIGAPVYSGNYATVGYVNGFDTGYLVADQQVTMIGVCRMSAPTVDARMFGRGEALLDTVSYMTSSTTRFVRSYVHGQQIQSETFASPGDVWVMAGASSGPVGGQSLAFVHNGESLVYKAGTAVAAPAVTNNLRMGATNYAASDLFHVAASVIYARQLSIREIVDVHAHLKLVLADRGVVLV